ncbi:MAG: MFS transporter, partial [Cyanobacteria bacterium P01_D01_bin.156]
YLTLYSLLPEGDIGNIRFFQTLGVASLIVAFMCFFILEEPKGSFAEAHEGEDAAAGDTTVPDGSYAS